MIVLWGPRADPMLVAVRDALHAPCVLVDPARPGAELDVRFDGALAGSLRAGSTTIALEEVEAIYLRPGPRGDERLQEACEAWLELTSALVVNREWAAFSGQSKPHQGRVIEAAGFLVPETLVTTDPATAEAFADAHPAVIFKSISGTRSIVTRLDAAGRARLPAVTTAPVQFQELVEGVDVRVHVVGEEVFAYEIACSAVDYRYADGAPPTLSPCALPDEVSRRCVALTATLGLTLAGIDLRRTPDGRWYCFEANTAPAFNYYDRDGAIAGALARTLAAATPLAAAA